MNNNPLVSIIVPCYNHEQFVQETIQSIIEQDYQNIELIIIDDGSQDNSVSKIKEMIPECKKRFARFEFRHRPNKGLCATLNEAIEWIKGEYYSAIASDDVLMKYKTKVQVNFLQKNNEINAVFGKANVIDTNSNHLYCISPSARKLSFKNIILSNYTILAPTQMIRTSAIKVLAKTNEIYPVALKIEDWYMWLKLAETGKLQNIPYVLALYRNHSNNTMKQKKSIQEERHTVLSYFNYSTYFKTATLILEIIDLLELESYHLFFTKIYQNPLLLCNPLFYKHTMLHIKKKILS